MRRRKRKPIRIAAERLWQLAAVILVLTMTLKIHSNMRELVAVYGENRCRNLVASTTTEVVSATETGEKFICFTEAENKNVLQMNGVAVRTIQTAVAASLAQKLEQLGEQSHRVRLGTVLDSLLLMDRGPEIAFRFVPVGNAQVSVLSDLQAAGINQVLYRAVLEVQVEMTVLLPGGNRRVECCHRIPLEEVLVTGEVPLVYGGETVAAG